MLFLYKSFITFVLFFGVFFFLPKLALHILSYVLRRLGRSIKSKTKARTKLIISGAHKEEEWRSKQSKSSPGITPEDEDWEKVDNTVLASVCNRARGDDEWEGIIGFFHPFW
jgi:alpha-1,2-mannosyltransferase